MTVELLAMRLRRRVEQNMVSLPDPWPAVVLFFSICDTKKRADVVTSVGGDFASAWRQGVKAACELARAKRIAAKWLRVDWVSAVETATWATLREQLKRTKRNYFRQGISLDPAFSQAFLEGELNANAMLYGGATTAHAVVNEGNFRRYASIRHGQSNVDMADDGPVYLFSTGGAFASIDGTETVLLGSTGLDSGRRVIDQLGAEDVGELVHNGSTYLASQVGKDGRFNYGWHPCFDRPIDAYNSLRHASTLYAMVEAWEVTRDGYLKAAIDRALSYLENKLIRTVTLGSSTLAFLVDQNSEIKLGGNAVCLLALAKFSELTGSAYYLDLLERLALGILHMQDAATGKFRHVLVYPTLEVKDDFRIIYYDGEAAFGLMRLYGLTHDVRWLRAVEKAFVHFQSAEHWKAHDHWLSYCVNELTRHRPSEAYYRFGIRNFADYLDFVTNRITTFPTLLELMMAARTMVSRIEKQPRYRHLLEAVDMEQFDRALHTRAHRLLDGHFWPEMAMYFANPERIAGSFFIRHHAFRVRIDDVEHYLSGFVAYLSYLEEQQEAQTPVADQMLVSADTR